VPHTWSFGAAHRHAPRPSQSPSGPQDPACGAAHPFFGSGLPAATGSHTPSVPVVFFTARQDWHEPLHALSQQIPSAQCADEQSESFVHPLGAHPVCTA
jgi:hypothetical protein